VILFALNLFKQNVDLGELNLDLAELMP